MRQWTGWPTLNVGTASTWRHNPPWANRPWVTRQKAVPARLGTGSTARNATQDHPKTSGRQARMRRRRDLRMRRIRGAYLRSPCDSRGRPDRDVTLTRSYCGNAKGQARGWDRCRPMRYACRRVCPAARGGRRANFSGCQNDPRCPLRCAPAASKRQ